MRILGPLHLLQSDCCTGSNQEYEFKLANQDGLRTELFRIPMLREGLVMQALAKVNLSILAQTSSPSRPQLSIRRPMNDYHRQSLCHQ